MLTIFSIPRAFKGQFDYIQRNAILSWKKVLPECEIILFGNEEGVGEAAKELGVKHISEVKLNECGTPLINDLFDKAQREASFSIMFYINSDIILTGNIIKQISKIKKEKFLLIGRRTDVDVKDIVDLENLDDLIEKGELHGFSGIDYFIFPKGFFGEIPPFALGRTAWDNWFLYRARYLKAPLIDATEVIKILHQNHDYSHHKKGQKGVWKGPESKINLELAGGHSHLLTIRDANWVLSNKGLKKPPFPRNILSSISMFYPWRLFLSIKRKIICK